MEKTTVNRLASYVDALRPIIYMSHFDSQVIDEDIKQIREGASCVEFNNALGAIDFLDKQQLQAGYS